MMKQKDLENKEYL
jgi:hypothetical protein